jgi:hypothetical protein
MTTTNIFLGLIFLILWMIFWEIRKFTKDL